MLVGVLVLMQTIHQNDIIYLDVNQFDHKSHHQNHVDHYYYYYRVLVHVQVVDFWSYHQHHLVVGMYHLIDDVENSYHVSLKFYAVL